MSLVASENADSGKDREPIPASMYQAVCSQVWDMGTQTAPFTDKKTGMPVMAHKVRLVWELPSAERIEYTTEDGEDVSLVRHMGREFTLSLHPKSHLRPFLEGWRGKEFTGQELFGFNIGKLIGANCTLQVIHKISEKYGKYAAIGAIVPLMDGMQKIIPENPTVMYEIEQPIPDDCPDWLREKIMASEEKKESTDLADTVIAGVDVDSIPEYNGAPFQAEDADIPF